MDKGAWIYCFKRQEDAVFLNRFGEVIKWFSKYEDAITFAENNMHLINFRDCSNADSEDEWYPYNPAEKKFQIIALRSLGFDHIKHGCTFEQSINGVIHLAASQKNKINKTKQDD